MLKNIDDEKKKSECLMKAIKERQIENQFNLKTQSTQEDIVAIKKTAQDQVNIRRNSLKSQIQKMRLEALRRQERLAGQLNSVRQSMAKTMSDAYKRGDEKRCQKGLDSEDDRKNYCVANFPEDFSQFSGCTGDKETFCRICCENEYGEMYNGDRTRCYNTICKGSKTGTGDTTGRWVWQTPH